MRPDLVEDAPIIFSMLALKFWRRFTVEMLPSGIVDPARTFMRTPAERLQPELQLFAQIHKCCRFKPDVVYPFATVFDRINEFVMYDPSQFIARFSCCGLAILQSDTCPVMVVIPSKVAEYLGLTKQCIVRHLDALQWTPVTSEAEEVQSLQRAGLLLFEQWPESVPPFVEFRIQSVPRDQLPPDEPSFERPETTPVDPEIVLNVIEQIVDRELECSRKQTAAVWPDDDDDMSQCEQPRPPDWRSV
jgi:hypothetical protein